MKTFTPQDITNYYDHTEPHYRQWWKMEESMGLHYGVWDDEIKSLSEAILNTNRQLAKLGDILPSDQVLDAGCGVGGSSIFLAKHFGCQVTGITLSKRQVKTATLFSQKNKVHEKVRFQQMDYTATHFPDHHFDVVWAIESMQTATDKGLFFKEMSRVLKPGGKLFIADVFKQGRWEVSESPTMQAMLHGWAMSDLLSLADLSAFGKQHNFALALERDATKAVARSVKRYYWFALLGMVGTKWYNLFHRGTHFGKVHYKTGLAQHRAWKAGLWSYHLLLMKKSHPPDTSKVSL
ncbi:MAG: methyltransferase domain-containing protein [Saprospiraceae bacterium]